MKNNGFIEPLRRMLQATGPYGNASADQFNENYFRNAELQNTDSAPPSTSESIENRKRSKSKK
ncbi:MAG: hypothetical protein ACOYJJ_02540 [Anaerovoracaceae bacterium]|jgi:hypothetical protein